MTDPNEAKMIYVERAALHHLVERAERAEAEAARLEAENKDLHQTDRIKTNEINIVVANYRKLEQDYKQAREALEAVEWVMDASNTHEPQFAHDRDECPWCFNERRNGHDDSCLRQQALGEQP